MNVIYQTPFRLYIEIGRDVYQYKRKVLNFLEVTGIIGGIFELFEVVFGIIIGMASSYSLRGQLIEEIKVNKKKNGELEKELKALGIKWLNSRNQNKENKHKEKNNEEEKFINPEYDIPYIDYIIKMLYFNEYSYFRVKTIQKENM